MTSKAKPNITVHPIHKTISAIPVSTPRAPSVKTPPAVAEGGAPRK